MIRQYLKTVYKKGGRGPVEYDCWGLAREVHHKVYGRPYMPDLLCAVPGKLRQLTEMSKQVHQDCGTFDCEMREGAFAEAWIGSLFVHIGIVVKVDGRLMILETDAPTGPVLTKPHVFASRYTKVRFFDTQQ